MKIRSDDAEIYYDVLGDGPAVVLLHAFPLHHGLWRPVAERLADAYRVVLMDLRGHGNSGTGDGPATMAKHAADVARVCDAAQVGKAVFGGVSIGGYVLFEFWRQLRERVSALILADTRPQADDDQARTARLQAAESVERTGPDAFCEALLQKLMAPSTLANRPDLVRAAREMMATATVAGIAANLRGLAQRPDSVATLSGITVPTLLLFGQEDRLSPVSDGELMRRHIASSHLHPNAPKPGASGTPLQVVPGGAHLAVFEQQDATHDILRKFFHSLPR
jgi:pimeloyl-ACP methyl ester carboxylesterase